MIRIAYHPIYQHPLPEGHRFPMVKYELIPAQLIREGIYKPEQFIAPECATEADILRAHDADYWRRMKQLELTEGEMRKVGFPLSEQLVEREIRIAQGTINGIYYAMEDGVSLNVAGGTHHAFTYKGEGFCLLNDIAIAAHHALFYRLAKQILVIDLDVHQGNGTAQIFKHTPEVFTFSMHGRLNYPFFKEQSDLDIELEDGTSDETYLGLMHQHIPVLLEKVRPQLVFFQSGVDILSTDKYGKLQVSPEGCKERDRLIFKWCKSLNIPIIASMGGGYSPKISDIVNAHCETFKTAAEIFF